MSESVPHLCQLGSNGVRGLWIGGGGLDQLRNRSALHGFGARTRVNGALKFALSVRDGGNFSKGQRDVKLSLHSLYEFAASSGFMITHAVGQPFLEVILGRRVMIPNFHLPIGALTHTWAFSKRHLPFTGKQYPATRASPSQFWRPFSPRPDAASCPAASSNLLRFPWPPWYCRSARSRFRSPSSTRADFRRAP